MNDVPYLLRGLRRVETESSVLVSSSKYLNDPRIRDWVSTHFLRKSGKDNPSPSDPPILNRYLLELQDKDLIEELFRIERARWPELDAWFNEGFVSTFTKEDLLDYPPGSLGHVFGTYVRDLNFELDLIQRFTPKTQYDYFRLRTGQVHDLEHLIGGGGYDILGELAPYYMRLTNIPKFLCADLAAELNLLQVFGSTRILMRTALHYPQAYPTALETVQRGMKVGQQSGPLFMAKYEDVMHLPIPQAREKLGVVGAEDVDTSAASAAWPEWA
jgi:ubiquinone biosynthesis protein Coq4